MIELGGAEYMVRGRGYAKSVRAIIENIVVVAATEERFTPIRVKDIGQVIAGAGPAARGFRPRRNQGEADFRHHRHAPGRERARNVIDAGEGQASAKSSPGCRRASKSFPSTTAPSSFTTPSPYRSRAPLIEVDRSRCALMVLLFLWHIPSAIIPMITIPIAVLIAFIPFHMPWGLRPTSCRSAGIAIAIGAHGGCGHRGGGAGAQETGASGKSFRTPRRLQAKWSSSAVKEVGGPSFFALLVIARFVSSGARRSRHRKAACSSPWRTPRRWPWWWPRSSPSRSTRRCGSL